MVTAILMMGGLGLIIGAGLAAASKIFYVYVDPKILAVDDALPGANCGGCGLPGCSANAEAIVAGLAAPNSCVAAGPEVAEAIAEIMGVTVEATEPDIALSGCYFGVEDADTKYIYNGLDDCRAAAMLGGGMKVCTIGCLGFGTCARVCPFNAITMGPEGLPVVIEERCTGCGTCERVCPKHIITLSSITRRIMREYTTEECTTPCQRSCPAGINIREYIRQIVLGNNRRAVQVIKERNPFPAVIGRICPRPCELDCRRNYVDEPVAINYLKRFAADFEKESGERILPYKAPVSGRSVAVVGGGVEGLSAAFFTARLGHDTTVFEAGPKLGGLLRSAIAKERLPEEILDWDIQGILDMGVKAETGKLLGKDFSINSLLEEGYEAVLLATGGWDSRLARGAVAEVESLIPGTFMLVDLLKFGTEMPGAIGIQADVVIYGGDRLALDAARKCRDMGAENITILFNQSPADSSVTDKDMQDLNASVVFDAALVHLRGEENCLAAIEYIEGESLEKQHLAAQTLIVAAGRFPELIFRREATPETDTTETVEASQTTQRWEAIPPYKQPAFKGENGIFADGDVLADYSAAIKAIGAGRRVAVSVQRMLYGMEPQLSERVITTESAIQNVDQIDQVGLSQRQIMPVCSGRELVECGEIERGFSEENAMKEASRCLQCGLVCYERTAETVQIEESVPAG